MRGIRIIAGEGKRRFLRTFKEDLSTRPLLGRIKKSLFDILAPRLPGARFLDLYAGTGAVGIEALSRGARCAVFVEASPRYVALIKENVSALGWSDRAEVRQADVTRGLSWLQGPFDLIYLGPPYKDENKKPLCLTSPTLRLVGEANLLNDRGLIISQHHAKEPIVVPEGLEMVRQNKYGDTFISFYRRVKGC